jgi:hypothetical protein
MTVRLHGVPESVFFILLTEEASNVGFTLNAVEVFVRFD